MDIAYDRQLLRFGNDTVIRCANLEAWIVYIAWVFGLRPASTRVIDYGSGPGLLVRMLRDLGFQAFAYEPYASATLVEDYKGDPSIRHDMLLAIETLEHFSEPAEELERVFSPGHDLIVARTQPYREDGPSWYYFFPVSGQHVFFYSHRARAWIARRFGYEVRSYGDMSIFSRRPLSALQRFMLDHHRRPLVLLKSLLPLAPRPGIARDDLLLAQQMRSLLDERDWTKKLRALAGHNERRRLSQKS